MNRELQTLDAAKSAFFSNASHELRTPLTLISAPLEDILNALSNDPKMKERISLALRNVSRLARLVDSLMDYARLEGGKLHGHFRPVRLGAFIADLASLFRSTIEENHVEVRALWIIVASWADDGDADRV